MREDDPLGVERHEPARGLARGSGAALNEDRASYHCSPPWKPVRSYEIGAISLVLLAGVVLTADSHAFPVLGLPAAEAGGGPLRYASDVSDEEWALLEPHLPAPCLTGQPRAFHVSHPAAGARSGLHRGARAPTMTPSPSSGPLAPRFFDMPLAMIAQEGIGDRA